MKGSVHQDKVEFPVGVADEPATAIVGHDLYLRIFQQALDLAMLCDERYVSGVDLHDGDFFDRWITGDDLGP